MRKFLLLVAAFGMAGCMMALLLLNIDVLSISEPKPGPAFIPAEGAQRLLADKPERTKPLKLPIMIPGTDLLAVRLGSYEGPFLEDGSDRNVFDVAMLEVRNVGSYMIKEASVNLISDRENFTFTICYLPPGETVLALNLEGQPSNEFSISSISGQQTVLQDKNFGLSDLEIRDVEMGATRITNRAGKEIADLKLYYKSTVGEGAYFVGGIAYTYPIAKIASGETVSLNLPHYAMGYCKIVAAEQ